MSECTGNYVTREELDLNNRTTELESTVKVSIILPLFFILMNVL